MAMAILGGDLDELLSSSGADGTISCSTVGNAGSIAAAAAVATRSPEQLLEAGEIDNAEYKALIAMTPRSLQARVEQLTGTTQSGSSIVAATKDVVWSPAQQPPPVTPQRRACMPAGASQSAGSSLRRGIAFDVLTDTDVAAVPSRDSARPRVAPGMARAKTFDDSETEIALLRQETATAREKLEAKEFVLQEVVAELAEVKAAAEQLRREATISRMGSRDAGVSCGPAVADATVSDVKGGRRNSVSSWPSAAQVNATLRAHRLLALPPTHRHSCTLVSALALASPLSSPSPSPSPSLSPSPLPSLPPFAPRR